MKDAIGGIEISSIAQGYEVADAMMKAAHVELLMNQTLCPGKLMLLIGGSNSSVQSALEAGVAKGGGFIADKVIIGNIHPEVINVLKRAKQPLPSSTVGVIEAFTAVGAIEAADIMVKGSNVELIKINMLIGIGGKGIVTVMGDIASVKVAVETVYTQLRSRNVMVNKAIISNPDLEILKHKKP